MAILYVDTQGSSIYREKGVLLVKKDDVLIKELPISQIDKIILVGGIYLSTGALNLILNNSIFTSFLTIDGRYKGSLFSGFSKNIDLRIKQFQKFFNPKFREDFSRIIINNKIKNLYSFLLKHKRNHKESNIDTEISKLKIVINKLKKVERFSLPQLLGVESIAAKYYFSAFGKIIRKEFSFERRTMHPPKDPVNSLLSLGYTLLLNEFVGLIYSHGLDPFIGYLHGTEYGRESLAVDLIEEFRFVVDAFVLKLINKKILVKEDFEFDKSCGYFKLGERGRKIFYEQYEKKLLTDLKEENIKTVSNYHKIFNTQVTKLSNFIDDENKQYLPFNYK